MLDFFIFAAFVALLVIPCVIASRKRAVSDQDDENNGTLGLLDQHGFPVAKPKVAVSERRPRLAARHVDPTTARAGGGTARARTQIR
jgi:hypothetical protein